MNEDRIEQYEGDHATNSTPIPGVSWSTNDQFFLPSHIYVDGGNAVPKHRFWGDVQIHICGVVTIQIDVFFPLFVRATMTETMSKALFGVLQSS